LALIKSISGVRGTIGGKPEANLTPLDVVEMTAAYGSLILQNKASAGAKIVIGRDARISGEMVSSLCIQTLRSMGLDVMDTGLSTTPTVEMAVVRTQADGGIIVTASHNPKEWNALKFLNKDGEFISALDGAEIIEIAKNKSFHFAPVNSLGRFEYLEGTIEAHINDILRLPLVRPETIREARYKIVVDCINSTGAISIVPLLEKLGCTVVVLNHEMTGDFAHNPEPLPAHLTALCEKVTASNADLGIAVDPDVDRLSFICPDGTLLGEENTLVAIAKYVLQHTPGATVSNLSSTRGLRDVTQGYGQNYYSAAVGEVNVVSKMKEVNAVIGGEGNGGVIYPALHYGRDALVGVALMLSYMALENLDLNQIKAELPEYHISKNKIVLEPHWDIRKTINELIAQYKDEEVNTEDGLKIDFADGWVQLRQSNTEPIIRVYSEAKTMARADSIAQGIIKEFKQKVNGNSTDLPG